MITEKTPTGMPRAQNVAGLVLVAVGLHAVVAAPGHGLRARDAGTTGAGLAQLALLAGVTIVVVRWGESELTAQSARAVQT